MENRNPAKKSTRLFTGLAGSPLSKVGRPRIHKDALARQRAYDRRQARERKRQEAQAAREQTKTDSGYVARVSKNGQPYAHIPCQPMSRGVYEDGRKGRFVLDGDAPKDYEGEAQSRAENIANAIEARLQDQWVAKCAAVAKGLLVVPGADLGPIDNFSRRVSSDRPTDDETYTPAVQGDSSTYLPIGCTVTELTRLEERTARNLLVDLAPNRKYDRSTNTWEPEVWQCPFHKRLRFGSQAEGIEHLRLKHHGQVRTATKRGLSGDGVLHDPAAARKYRKRHKAI
jgi:hypothetical protein